MQISLVHIAPLPLLLIFSACGDLPGFSVSEKTDSFQQSVVKNNKIDLLFVVDNSGSMADEQELLAQSFERFIEKFSEKNLDFQVAVISSDNTTSATWWSSSTGAYANFPNVGPGSILAYRTNERILRPTTNDYINKFKQNVKIGIRGSGAEAPIKSATKALSPELLGSGGFNEGLVRPEAMLAVIVVSDEDESVATGTSSADRMRYIRTLPTEAAIRKQAFLDRINEVKPERSLVSYSAITAPSEAVCPNLVINDDSHRDPNGNYYKGTGDLLMDIAHSLNGQVIPICNDFSEPLINLGEGLVQLLSRFKLKQRPESQIQVLVNGRVIPRNAAHGWEYLADTNEVEFRGNEIPSAEAKIAVVYVPGEPLR